VGESNPNRKEHTMTQYATPREHLDATRQAVATAEDAYVRRALDSVEWERRGLLQRLRRGGGPLKAA
jgi:hypothetical protein